MADERRTQGGVSDHRPVHKGEEEARERDPHGTAPAEDLAEGEPKGRPSSDRHETEAAAGEPSAGHG